MNIYYLNFIDFLQRHNLYDAIMFEYIRARSTIIDYKDEEQYQIIGCYYSFDKKNRLTKFELYVPFINNHETTLINIHEYVHAISLYQKLGKRYTKESDVEILPMLYELLYVLETNNEELKNYLKDLNKRINTTNHPEYQLGLDVQQELLKYYQEENPNFKKIQNKSKQLSKKHQKQLKLN